MTDQERDELSACQPAPGPLAGSGVTHEDIGTIIANNVKIAPYQFNRDKLVLVGIDSAARDILALLSQPPRSEQEAYDPYPYKEALAELVSLRGECLALNGGGPGFQKRWESAWINAAELTRSEP